MNCRLTNSMVSSDFYLSTAVSFPLFIPTFSAFLLACSLNLKRLPLKRVGSPRPGLSETSRSCMFLCVTIGQLIFQHLSLSFYNLLSTEFHKHKTVHSSLIMGESKINMKLSFSSHSFVLSLNVCCCFVFLIKVKCSFTNKLLLSANVTHSDVL